MHELFLLDPAVVFLNHGSFGATPLAVHRAAEAFRLEMERQPVRFLGREILPRLHASRDQVAEYVGASPETLAFVPNATYGVNVVARSLESSLRPGDEIIATDHEYGACTNTWEAVCGRTGAIYVRQPLPLPDEIGGGDAVEHLVDAFWAGVTERTRVIYLSHITSPTAMQLPVEAIIARARDRGILTLIDGAHAPGQIPLNLDALGADFYTGNCHKWLCAPKGSAMLQVRAKHRALIEPLVVSWGSPPERQFLSDNDMWDALTWSGTNDFSAWLAVPAAIEFQREHGWDSVRARCAALLDAWLPRLAEAASMPALYPAGSRSLRAPQMGLIPLPAGTDLAALKQRLYDLHAIEIPVIPWRGRKFLRLSVQGYITPDDLGALERALQVEIPRSALR